MLRAGSGAIILKTTKAFLSDQLRLHGMVDPVGMLSAYQPKKVTTDREWMRELVHCSYNRSMGPKVIGNPVKARLDDFIRIVCNYDAAKILSRWKPDGHQELYAHLVKKKIAPKSSNRRPVYWTGFCKSIIGAAQFVEDWPLERLRHEIGCSELAELGAIQLIAAVVPGYGLALSADVLRSSGLIDSIKPDTHIKKLARLLGLERDKDAKLLLEFNRLCRTDGISCYEFDKMVWFVYSGYFYLHKDVKFRVQASRWEELIAAELAKLASAR
jgi:hypothetical protein